MVRTVPVSAPTRRPPVFGLEPSPFTPPLRVRRIGSDVLGHDRGVHAHDFVLLLYLESGAGSLRWEGGTVPVGPGTVVAVAPGAMIRGVDAGAAAGAAGWQVLFDPDLIAGLPAVPGHTADPVLGPLLAAEPGVWLTVPPDRRVAWSGGLAAVAAELAGRRRGWEAAAVAGLTLLLVELARLVDPADPPRPARDPLLSEVAAVIERDHAGPLSLREVARAVGRSPGHVAARVRAGTGRSVGQWILERRMRETRRLLAGTDLPVVEVARLVGLPDPGYLTRVFRREHGIAPTGWRRAATGSGRTGAARPPPPR